MHLTAVSDSKPLRVLLLESMFSAGLITGIKSRQAKGVWEATGKSSG